MRAEVVKAWIGIMLASLPLTWAVFASADTVYGFVVVVVVLAFGFYLGYAFNRRGVHPALLICLAYPVAFFAVGFAITAETVAAWILVGVALLALTFVCAGIGSLGRRHIKPRPGDGPPLILTTEEVMSRRAASDRL